MSILILTVARTRLVRHFLSDSITFRDSISPNMPHGLVPAGDNLNSFDDELNSVSELLTLTPDAEDANNLDDAQDLSGTDALASSDAIAFSDDIRGSLGFD